MPKVKSALKRARKLFASSAISESDSESISSDNSEEYSHVPLRVPLPLLSTLSLSESDNMEQVIAQLQSMTDAINRVNAKQTEQDQKICSILDRINTDDQPNPANPGVQPQQPQTFTFGDLCKIPDPIKLLQSYDGNRRQLNAWLSTAEETLGELRPFVSEKVYKIYVTAVSNKITGKAKDILCLAGNPNSFEDIKSILITALGDRQELSTYKCQLWQLNMSDGVSLNKYYQRSRELVQNIKTLAKQNPKFTESWGAINEFIDQDALAAFTAGLEEPLFGHVQAARPKDMEDAYAFLCTFKSRETTANNMKQFNKIKRFPKNNQDFKDNTFKSKPNLDTEKPEAKKDYPQPMDIGSTRSRLTLNKRTFNNNEVAEKENSESSESEDETENLDLNFCQAIETGKTT